MATMIPEPLKAEHDELHAALVRATRAGGRTGEAARAVARLLHPHFEQEEAFALPPLGLLPALAAGDVRADMAEVLEMTRRLRERLPAMLDEHRAIVGALDTLREAARAEAKPEHATFADKLILHARTEEEVLYPAALLVGAFLTLRLPA
jgi:hypothetical protein